MREIEIVAPPDLDAEKQRTVDLHSLTNILNIISLQLGELEMDFADYSGELLKLENEIHKLSRSFHTEDSLAPRIEQLRCTEAKILTQIEAMLKTIDFAEHRSQLKAARENFVSIYEILNVRLDEFAFRLNQPDVWIEIETSELSRKMQDVFRAIEKNANGKYYIHFNLALKNTNDYYIDIRIETKDPNNKIWMPLRLKDVLRDLVANGRKYTKPGGKVALAVHQNEEHIQCVIEDSGCGIPEEELEQVVQFGYRASNVRQFRTMGGGFGLTKAVWLVLSWGGQFFIASEEKLGTRIKIILPNKPRDS